MFSSGLCKSIISVEIYYILMETQNIIFFDRLTKEFDTLFDYTFQEGPKLKLLNVTIIKSEHVIIIDQTYHIIKNIVK